VGLDIDSYSLGGTVERLERKFSEMLGKEASIFMPTGTLANHLAIRKHCAIKRRAVVQEQSHLYNDTGDCAGQLSGINLVPLAKDRPYFTLDELKEAVVRSETGRVANPIGAVMIESPVRRQAGRVVPFAEMEAITRFCAQRDIPTHLDGARLYMMSAATGVKPREYAALFDTVYVSLYKYFDAHIGAILAGRRDFIDGLHHDRRMFGGGLNAAYLPAALAIKGTEGFEERFAAAMSQARDLFDMLNELEGISIGRFEHGSNIFPSELGPGVDVDEFTAALRRHRVFVYPDEEEARRIPLAVNTTILRNTNGRLMQAFADAIASSTSVFID
jgi:threonine aldolase